MGKPQQFKKRGFKTKQEAQRALNELEHSLISGTYIKPNKMLYREFMINHWLEDKVTNVKKQTLATYKWLIVGHVLPALGDIELAKLTPMAIQKFYNHLINNRQLTDENIQKIHTLINESLKKAERWELIQKNPAALVDRPKATKKEVVVWDVDEVKTFLKYGDNGGRYFVAFLIALTSGARQGEILGLRWRDVDFDNSCIRISQTLSSDGKEILPYTKTKSGARSINLPEETMKQLAEHKRMIDREKKLAAPGSYHELDLVICSELGAPTNKSNIRRSFNTAIKRAKGKKDQIPFHATYPRHVAAASGSESQDCVGTFGTRHCSVNARYL